MTTWQSLPPAHAGDDRKASQPSLRKTVRADTHSRKLETPSKSPAVTTPRVDFGSSSKRDVVRQLAVLREHRARPQHLQVLRAVLHRLVVEPVQLGENHLRQRVEPVRHPLERAALAESGPCAAAGPSSSIAAAASGSTSSLRAARGGGARPCPSEGAADGRCSPRGPQKGRQAEASDPRSRSAATPNYRRQRARAKGWLRRVGVALRKVRSPCATVFTNFDQQPQPCLRLPTGQSGPLSLLSGGGGHQHHSKSVPCPSLGR